MPAQVVQECEILCEGETPALKSKNCTKNPGHKNFIPVKNFTEDHLPKKIRTEKLMRDIKDLIRRTVHIKVNYTSKNRPDTFDDTKVPYPARGYKGRFVSRTGTGYITDASTRLKPQSGDCPCPPCKESGSPKKRYWKFHVRTATHVVYDNAEAQETVIKCFYDSEEQNYEDAVKLYGVGFDSKLSQEERYKSDMCDGLECVTHNEESVKNIESRIGYQPSQFTRPKEGNGILVSHPHGGPKMVSVGKMYRTLLIKPGDERTRHFFREDAAYYVPSESIVEARVYHRNIKKGSTYTLPDDAEYHMKYHYDKKGFTLPPGTKFHTKYETEIKTQDGATIPDNAVFVRTSFEDDPSNHDGPYTFVTYDIPTCPGSSGAAVPIDSYNDNDVNFIIPNHTIPHTGSARNFNGSCSTGHDINLAQFKEGMEDSLRATERDKTPLKMPAQGCERRNFIVNLKIRFYIMTWILTFLAVELYQRHVKKWKKMMKTSERKSNQESPQECHTVTDREDEEVSSKDFVKQLPSVKNHAYVFFTSVSTEDIEVIRNLLWRLFNDGYLLGADDFLDLSGAVYPLFANQKTHKVPLIDFTDPLEEITAPVSCLNRRERIFKHRSAHKLIFTIKNLTHSQTSAVIQFLSKIIGFKHWRYKYTLINENRMLLVVRCCMQRVGSVIWKTYVITAIIPLLIYGAPRPVGGKPVDRFPQERCIENSKAVEFRRFETNKKEIPLPWKVQGDFSIPPSPNTPCPQNGHRTSSNNRIIENTELHLVNGELEDKETCVYQRREQDVALNELIERTDPKNAEFRHADVAFNHFSPGNHSVHPIIYPVHGSNVSLLSIHGLMKHEILRIRSYNQQITMPIYSVTQLAQNGFYCSGQNGEVTCFNCERKHPTFLSGLSLDETSHMGGCGTTREINNVPLHNGTGGLTSADLDLFHAIYGYQGNSSSFSNLDASSISSKDFVQQLPSVENHAYVFFTSVSTEDIEVRQNAYWRLFNDGYLPEADNFLDLSGAAYPLFANRRTRKDTFHSWDPTHSQKPEILVNMGFFYAGYSDCARCFYCGLGLKYWRPNDDAAYQHARFRPQCKYNQFVQGQVFVDQVQRAISTENTQV